MNCGAPRTTRRRAGLRLFLRSERGAAAAELALILVLMVAPLANVVDVAFYAFRRMQVELAAEAGVQAIRAACGPSQYPVTQFCATGLLAKITTAVQSTTLGSNVVVQTGSPAEGYYCVNGSQTLTQIGSTGTVGSPPPKPSPFNCSSVGSSAAPGDYVQVSASYSFTSVFPNASVVSLLPSPITRTAWYRVN